MKTIYGATDDDYLIYREGSGDTIEIFDIVVNSKRRCGIGKSMIRKLMASIPRGTKLVWAITRSENFIAQQFYESERFRIIAVLREFYKDGDHPPTIDAIMYGRDIAQ